MIMKHNHSNEIHRILHKKYRQLEGYKIHAMNKAIKKFDAIPIEMEDLEHLAWTAFLEVEEKYKVKKWEKSYENFFIDCVFWKANDYCRKYTNNKYRLVNHAVVTDFVHPDYKDNGIDETDIIRKLAINDYVKKHSRSEKGRVAKMIMNGESLTSITEALCISKYKTYRLMSVVKTDLKRLLDL